MNEKVNGQEDNQVVALELDLPKELLKLKAVKAEDLQKAYEKLYKVSIEITLEDEDEVAELDLFFNKPKTVSFNRYIKNMSRDSLTASNDFVLDNIVKEQHEGLVEMLKEYPATALNAVEKLLRMLGFAKSTNFKKL